jgi:hypothetical protein
VVADGAYAKRPFLRAARAAGVVVVSRLRKDAALWSLPVPPRSGAPKRRGRPPTYGKQAISLAKRAGQCRSWQSEELVLYGKAVIKTYKTFLATYRPAGGLIVVVLVREEDGWVAFFCTDPTATAAVVLGAVAARGAVEQDYHDIKEVHGAPPPALFHCRATPACSSNKSIQCVASSRVVTSTSVKSTVSRTRPQCEHSFSTAGAGISSVTPSAATRLLTLPL